MDNNDNNNNVFSQSGENVVDDTQKLNTQEKREANTNDDEFKTADLNSGNIEDVQIDNATEGNSIPNFQLVNQEINNEDVKNERTKKEKPKTKRGLGKRIISYVAVGLIFAIIGGTAGTAGLMLLMKKSTKFQSTALYKSIVGTSTGTLYTESATSSKQASLISTSGGLSVSEISKKVGPAVVGVAIKSVSTQDEYNYFFNNNNSSSSDDVGFGSGIIINKEGYILTNYHVIESALTGDQVKIVLNNNKEVSAKIVNYDSSSDIAIVKMTGDFTVPAVAELGDSSKAQVGDTAVAIGNPMGKELLGSVTVGIISALNRQIEVSGKKYNYIQTDAAINSGNSGGALVNSQGQVIGMNTAKYGGSGVEGLGFAIPINDIKTKINNLISTPMNTQLMLGITCTNIDSEIASQYNATTVGIGVTAVTASSAAEKAGIKKGDIIVKFDEKTVKTVDELNEIKAKHKVGDTIKIQIVRSNRTMELSLTFK